MIKNMFYGVLLILVLIIIYASLNNSYNEAVEKCSKNHNVEYCKQALSK